MARFPGQIISHHTVPAGVYRRASYHQAYGRGVKIIGATAHYVNDNEIWMKAQSLHAGHVIHVDHTYTAEDAVRAGRDVEKNVLSRALYQVLARRSLFTAIGRLFFNRRNRGGIALIRCG